MKSPISGLAMLVCIAAPCVISCSSPSGDTSLGPPVATVSEALTSTRRRDAEGFELTVVVDGKPQHMTVSAAGSIATLGGTGGAPQAEAAVDYAKKQVLIKDYATQTYSVITLADYVSQQQTSLTNQGSAQTPPERTVRRTRLRQRIAGIAARAYLSTSNQVTSRLWYAEDLPLPPPDIRRQLIAIGPLAQAAKGGSREDDDRDQDYAHDEDDAHGEDRARDQDHAREAMAAELAGRTILRTERKDASGRWTVTNDTLSAKRTPVPPSSFVPPAGWTQTSLPSTPRTVSAAFDSIGECSTQDDPATTVGYSGGMLLRNAKVYVNYFGPGFQSAYAADPTGFDRVFTAGVSKAFSGSYFSTLKQYGLESGEVEATHFLPHTPSGALSDFLSDEVTVETLEDGGFVPGIWWRIGDGGDPLVFLMYDDAEASASYAGYHLAAPSNAWFALPFPFNVLAFPLIPYAAAVMPHNALSVTSAKLSQRDLEDCADDCVPIEALDAGTVNMSHELVEALTDPFEFSGWANPNLVPAWNDGEIADICELSCPNGDNPARTARVDDTVLSTFWSTVDSACFPVWQPLVWISNPTSGVTVPTGDLTVKASLRPQIVTGERAAAALVWSVDGVAIDAHGTSATVSFSTPGTHSVEVFYRDPETFVHARDSIAVYVIASPPGGANCSAGDGACEVWGTLDAAGNCGAVPGTPDDTWHTSSAPNGNWDWACTGHLQQEFPVHETALPISCSPAYDGQFCASLGSDERVCNDGNANNIGEFYFPCSGSHIICGEPLLHQQCWFSQSKHTCMPGANEVVQLGCK